MEINEIENRSTTEKMAETKSWFSKMNKIENQPDWQTF